MSRRTEIAKDLGTRTNRTVGFWLDMLYRLEEAGYQVVKTSETAEFQGLRNAGGSDGEAS